MNQYKLSKKMKKLYYISRKGKTLNYLLLEKLNIINSKKN